MEQIHRLEVVRQAFEKRKYCLAVFIEVTLALNKVCHEGLISQITLNLLLNNNAREENFWIDSQIMEACVQLYTACRKILRRLLKDLILEFEKCLKLWRTKINEQICVHITFTLLRNATLSIQINNKTLAQKTQKCLQLECKLFLYKSLLKFSIMAQPYYGAQL